MGTTLVRGKIRGAPAEAGAIPYYQGHPEELRRDAGYLKTWRTAVLIARSARAHAPSPERWTTSGDLAWIPRSNQVDAWGHTFCVESSSERTVVVSPGPHAVASLDCGTLHIPESDLARLAPGRLNLQASGVLVLVARVAKRGR